MFAGKVNAYQGLNLTCGAYHLCADGAADGRRDTLGPVPARHLLIPVAVGGTDAAVLIRAVLWNLNSLISGRD